MMLRPPRQAQGNAAQQPDNAAQPSKQLSSLSLSKGWELKKLNEVCLIKPPKKEAKELLNEQDLVSFVPMKVLGINKKYFKANDAKHLKAVSGSYTYFRNNDVLLAKITPCFENGKLGIANNLENGIGFGSSEFIVYRAKESLTPEFLYYFLNQPSFRAIGGSQMTGAVGHKRIPKGFYEEYNIPIPPLEEQTQIVALLDKTFAAIDQAKTNVEKNLQNAKELFQSKLNEIFTQKGEGWEEKKLGDKSLVKMIDGDRGKNYPKKSDFFTEGHCVFMNTGNVRPNGFDFSNVMFITEERDNLLRKGKLQRDDVVMTTRGTIGNLGWYNKDVKYDNIRINSGMLVFRVNPEKILPEFLFAVFRSSLVTKQIAEMTSGAAQPQLPIKTLVHFDIPIHFDLNKQKEMVSKIQEMEFFQNKLIQVYNRKITSLDELKKSILQKAFAGELSR